MLLNCQVSRTPQPRESLSLPDRVITAFPLQGAKLQDLYQLPCVATAMEIRAV